MYQLGIVRFDGEWWKAIQLIDTDDNKRAVHIARDLLRYGEAVEMKERAVGKLELPDPTGNYRTPIQTIRPARKKAPATPKVIADLIEIAMGFKPSV